MILAAALQRFSVAWNATGCAGPFGPEKRRSLPELFRLPDQTSDLRDEPLGPKLCRADFGVDGGEAYLKLPSYVVERLREE